jgi:hypothetical protein
MYCLNMSMPPPLCHVRSICIKGEDPAVCQLLCPMCHGVTQTIWDTTHIMIVLPALHHCRHPAGAKAAATFAAASAAAGHAAGDVAAQSTTDVSGSFRLGPLYTDAEYTVQLSKTGHIITPPSITTTPAAAGSTADSAEQLLRFSSKQLASVAVSVDLPAGTSPSAVFLSLSGSGGFSSNARLGPDSTLAFQDLRPGTYYLKPLLREHQFEPPVADLALEDGQAATVTLRAVRNAWGISGAVTSGEPVSIIWPAD